MKRRFKLPFLYPIVDLDRLSDPLAFVEALLGAELRLLQIRSKQLPDRAFLDHVQLIISHCRTFSNRVGEYVTIIINDRADICEIAEADGVHVGQEELAPELIRKIIGSNKILGYSTHNFAQIEQANDSPVDYIGFGPVFATASKRNPDPVVGLEQLSKAVALSRHPLVAIGGIDSENCFKVYTKGVQSVAVIGDLVTTNELGNKILSFSQAFSAATLT